MEKVAIYIRVSTKKQIDKYSPQEQRRILVEYAKSREWEIVDFYSDLGESGTNAERDDLDRLLVDAERKLFSKVLLFEQDRLSRLEQLDWAYLANSLARLNIKIITPTSEIDLDNEEDRFLADLFNLLANREVKKIKKRTSMGRVGANRDGIYFAAEAPFGCIYNREGNTWRTAPEEVEVMKLAFNLYVENEIGFSATANRLNSLGYRTRKGGKFAANTLRKTMFNPAHTGFYTQTVVGETLVHKIEWEDGHGAYITTEQYEKMKMLATQKANGNAEYFHEAKYLLSGLLVCGECGKKLRMKTEYFRSSKKEHVYKTYLHGYEHRKECKVRHKASLVDAKVLTYLREMAGNAEFIKGLIQDKKTPDTNKPTEHDFSEISSSRDKLLKRKSKLLDLFMDNEDWTKEELSKKKREVEEDLKALDNRESELNKRLVSSEQKVVNIDTVAENLQIIQKIGDELTPKEQHSILKKIVSQVVVKKDGTISLGLIVNNGSELQPKYATHPEVYVSLP